MTKVTPSTLSPRAAALCELLWSTTRRSRLIGVYALLDCARDPAIFPALEASGLEYRCFFSRPLPRLLRAASPHLVRLARDADLTAWLAEKGWGNAFGVYLTSATPMPAVWAHLRALWRTEHEGKPVFFRYYDPRVLRAYAPTIADAPNLRAVFGPVSRFYVEDENPAQCLVFARNLDALASRVHNLEA
ncbi:MAG: DUF4123 domain-containing protein [Desulfovibrionaceae bacterium]